MPKTHWKKIVCNSPFLGEGDFGEGEEKIVTIDHVKGGVDVKNADGTSQEAVVYWREKDVKPMILNKEKSEAIEAVAGSAFVEDWPGVQVQLYIKRGVRAFGRVVNAVRVRDKKPRIKPPIPPCTDCGKPIQEAQGRSAEWWAGYTAKKFGVPLCVNCGAKRAEVAQRRATSEENPDVSREELSQDGEDASGGNGGELL